MFKFNGNFLFDSKNGVIVLPTPCSRQMWNNFHPDRSLRYNIPNQHSRSSNSGSMRSIGGAGGSCRNEGY